MIELDFNEEKKILKWEMSNKIMKEDFIMALEKSKTYFQLNDEVRIIEFDNDSEMQVNPLGHIQIALHGKKIFKDFKLIKVAIVVNKPVNVAYAVLALNTLTNRRLGAKVFSTTSAAEDWLSF